MKFNIKHVRILKKNFRMFGRGSVSLHETALILEGMTPRFTVSLLVVGFFEGVMGDRSYRTLPYTRIVDYKPPGKIGRRYHKITYEDPEGKRLVLAFKIKEKSPSNRLFTARLQEHLVAASAI